MADEAQADRELFRELVAGIESDRDWLEAVVRGLSETADAVRRLARALAEGGLRADFRVDEIGLVMSSVSATMVRGTGDWHGHLEIVIDGLRRAW